MGGLARLPGGKAVIQVLGHMRPDERLAVERNRLKFATPVGLGCRLDPVLTATPALDEFGFGFLEIGPVAAQPPLGAGRIVVDAVNEAIRCDAPQAALAPVVIRERLQQDGPFRAAVLVRIEPTSPEQAREMLASLGECVDGFVVPVERLDAVVHAAA